MNDLQGLIEINLPRPTPDHPKYHRWATLSVKVGSWLRAHLDHEIYFQLPSDVAHADDVITAITALVSGSQTQTQPERIRSQPPKNTDPRQYAAAWCHLTTQTAPNGNCLYCDGEDHGTAGCLYLCPEKRGSWWEPSAALWYLDGCEDEVPWEERSAGLDTPGSSVTAAAAASPTPSASAQAGEKVVRITSGVPMTEVLVKFAEPGFN